MVNARMLARAYALIALGGFVAAQAPAPTITLADALQRARKYGGQVQSANLAVFKPAKIAFRRRSASLPSVSAFNQYINTEGNGTPSGVFVANDGVHVYNEQAVVHEEALMLVRHGEMNRAMAAEAIARAKVDVAARGLNATVIQNYYAIAQRAAQGRQRANQRREAEQFVDITQKQEKGGEAAHADVIKAQIDSAAAPARSAGCAGRGRKGQDRAGRADLSRFQRRVFGGRRSGSASHAAAR